MDNGKKSPMFSVNVKFKIQNPYDLRYEILIKKIFENENFKILLQRYWNKHNLKIEFLWMQFEINLNCLKEVILLFFKLIRVNNSLALVKQKQEERIIFCCKHYPITKIMTILTTDY